MKPYFCQVNNPVSQNQPCIVFARLIPSKRLPYLQGYLNPTICETCRAAAISPFLGCCTHQRFQSPTFLRPLARIDARYILASWTPISIFFPR
jgi:hypothetical protein